MRCKMPKRILLYRGFSEEDIDTNFENYTGQWNIKTITKEEISNSPSPEQLRELFAMDSLEYTEWCATYPHLSFNYFADKIEPFNVSASELDPFIARLCIAINSIGVKTTMSCDGWHKDNASSNQMKLYMRDRYSVIWFWLITQHIFGENYKTRYQIFLTEEVWSVENNEPDGIGGYYTRDMLKCPYYSDYAKNVFLKQNCYAAFIEKHKDEFLSVRKQLIYQIKKRYGYQEIDHEIAQMDFEYVKNTMEQIFLWYAQPLKNAFKEECYKIVEELQDVADYIP